MGDPPPTSPPRGSRLLEAHLRAYDPNALTATERLYAAVGRDLGQLLVSALAPRRRQSSRAA